MNDTPLSPKRWLNARIFTPGPTGDIYAFTRESVQRNLYRIPLP